YDALGRPVTQTEAADTAVQRTATTVYDPTGNVLSVTAAQTYDADPAPRAFPTTYRYDAPGRRTGGTAAQGVNGLQRTTTLAYDAYDHLVEQTTPQTYDRDANGNPPANPLRFTTRYDNDLLGRRVGTTEAVGVAGLQRSTVTNYDPAD